VPRTTRGTRTRFCEPVRSVVTARRADKKHPTVDDRKHRSSGVFWPLARRAQPLVVRKNRKLAKKPVCSLHARYASPSFDRTL
jgi:hypothetical protein